MPLGLKKCPLCGSEDIKKVDYVLKYVKCTKCGFQTSAIHFDTLGKAIEHWNRRNKSCKLTRLRSRMNYDIYVKDCPLCTQNPDAPEKSVFLICDYDRYWVICMHCGAKTGVYETKEEAIEAWSTRVREE